MTAHPGFLTYLPRADWAGFVRAVQTTAKVHPRIVLSDRQGLTIQPGDEFFIAAGKRIRGAVRVTGLFRPTEDEFAIGYLPAFRPFTTQDSIKPFKALRIRWWRGADELPLDNWQVL